MTVGQKIYNLRERGGLTQTDFAEKVGVDLATVRMWENGMLPVDIKTAVLLSKAFSVEPEYFEDDKEFPDAHLFGDSNVENKYPQPVCSCRRCGLPIYDKAKANKRNTGGKGSYNYYICGICADKEAEMNEKRRAEEAVRAKKRRRNSTIGWSIFAVVVIVAIIVIVAVV